MLFTRRSNFGLKPVYLSVKWVYARVFVEDEKPQGHDGNFNV
jgi:hypothetical protein